MLFERPTDDIFYEALLARDPAYDGFAYVCVASTHIFCRFTCPARKPKRENCSFKDSIGACLEGGFRPCLRCKPMQGRLHDQDAVVSKLMGLLEDAQLRRWTEADLVSLGFDLTTVRRRFKRQFGISFLEMARLRRIGHAAEQLSRGGSVIEAQLDAGFDSGSGFRTAVTQLIGSSPAGLQGRPLLKADWIDTPIGPMLAIVCQHALHLLEFADRPALPTEITRLRTRSGSAIAMGRTDVTETISHELKRYFDGHDDGFCTRLSDHGTPFERSVWAELRRRPTGTTHSYASIATAIGRSTASRAVARANGANQIAIVIPCHRIVGADGALTGYGGGLWRKRWLIEHERRMMAKAENAGSTAGNGHLNRDDAKSLDSAACYPAGAVEKTVPGSR